MLVFWNHSERTETKYTHKSQNELGEVATWFQWKAGHIFVDRLQSKNLLRGFLLADLTAIGSWNRFVNGMNEKTIFKCSKFWNRPHSALHYHLRKSSRERKMWFVSILRVFIKKIYHHRPRVRDSMMYWRNGTGLKRKYANISLSRAMTRLKSVASLAMEGIFRYQVVFGIQYAGLNKRKHPVVLAKQYY